MILLLNFTQITLIRGHIDAYRLPSWTTRPFRCPQFPLVHDLLGQEKHFMQSEFILWANVYFMLDASGELNIWRREKWNYNICKEKEMYIYIFHKQLHNISFMRIFCRILLEIEINCSFKLLNRKPHDKPHSKWYYADFYFDFWIKWCPISLPYR